MSLKERLSLATEPIYLVDGTAYVYRAFYAFPDLKRSDGFPTNALFIVLKLLIKLIREENPRYLGFFLDGRGPTFRNELYPQYKAQREATPEHLISQLEPIQRGVGLLGFKVEVSDGVEADDLIASMAAKCKVERPVIIVGADKDLRQCLDSNVIIWDPMAKREKLETLESFVQETGLRPEQWPDFQAVIGDSSDNIPGVPGVGPKTAAKIFDRLPDIKAITRGLDQLTPAERKKVEPHVEQLFTYRKLTTLRTDLLDQKNSEALIEAHRRIRPEHKTLAGFLQEFEFRSLLHELTELAGSAPRRMEQGTLFAQTPPPPKVDIEQTPEPAELARLLEGREVGLLPVQKEEGGHGLHLAVADREFHHAGDTTALAACLAKAERVHTPDVKALLTADPAWEAVPVEQWFDLGLGAYLINPEERDYGFDKLRERFADFTAGEANPALQVLQVGGQILRGVREAGLETLMRELELPLIPVLAHMEQAGIGIDPQAFEAFLLEVRREIARHSKAIHKYAGGQFNIRSSQQLGQVLFETLGLKTAGKTPKGSASTSQAALEKLQGQHPIIEEIMEFRKLEKMRSTYLEPLPKLMDAEGRLHTTFNQLATATGRLSSSNPNLQNIPIRGPMGRRMRQCFRSGQGLELVAADYSQIELRVLAHCSQDPTLLEAFANDEDIHSRTAGLLFDKDPAAIGPDERRGAKTINFGLIYGMGPQKLARDLAISLNEAKGFIERYFNRLTRLREFYEQVEATAKEQGFVTTLAGRRRWLPDINSRNNQLQSQARRQAINTVIQGSAADIIKAAMIQAHGDQALAALHGRILLQVHDELVFEAPEQAAADVGRRLAEIMTSVHVVADFSVPLKVDWGHGRTWAEAH
jgi:DNA polymerase I